MQIRTLVAACVCCLFSLIGSVYAQTIPQIAKKSLAATVLIEMVDSTGKTLGIGNGFYVKPNTIATNYRLIQGASRGAVKQRGIHKMRKVSGVIATDKDNDLALLNVPDYGITPLSLIQDGDTIQIGDNIYVAGYPKDLEGTFATGTITHRTDQHLLMSAPITPGNSGGPVLNTKGEVIGVALSRYATAHSQNIVIPADALKTLLARMQQPTSLSQLDIPVSADTYFQWGYEKYLQGKYAEAITHYTMVIHLDQKNVADAYNHRGIAKEKLGQSFAAIADYNTAIQLDPENALAYKHRGISKATLGEHAQAISDYDTAIQLKSITAYRHRGLSKAALGHYESAITDYDAAIKQHPADVSAITHRGIARAGLTQYKAAIVDYDTALTLKPDTVLACYHRGVAKAALGHYTLAIDDYNIAIKLDPDHALAYTHRGIAKSELGQYTGALADFDAALRKQAKNALAYYHRGIIKSIYGYATDAQHDLRIAQKYAQQEKDVKLKAAIAEALQQKQ